MAVVPFSLGAAADLLDPAIQQIFVKSSDIEKTTYYDKYYNIETGVSDRVLKDSSISAFGEASRIVENAVITAESPVQGFDISYTQVEYGKLASFTKQMWAFGIKKRDVVSIVQDLKGACLRHKEKLCGDGLDQSYNSSYTVTDDSGSYTRTIAGGDTAAFVSASHTREDGGTAWSNRVSDGTTVNMDLDYDAIKAAHRTAALIKDPKGNTMDINLDTIVVRRGHANEFRAREILGAVKAGGKSSIPGAADNDAAGVPAYTIIATPWITTYTGYWWMTDSSMKGQKFGFQLKQSQPIMLEGPNKVFKTGEIQYKATEMYDLGFNDSRSWVGSKGTNAS